MPLEPTIADLQADIDKYKKAMEENPESRLFAALADSLRRAGEVREAISVAEAGVEKHPRYISGIVVLAQSYLDDGKHEKALEHFQQVIKMNPENIAAQRALAEIYDHLGDHGNALKAYNAITILAPADHEAKQRLAILEATAPKSPPQSPAPSDQEPEREKEIKEPDVSEPEEPEEDDLEDGHEEPSGIEDPEKTVELTPSKDKIEEDTDPGVPPPSALEWKDDEEGEEGEEGEEEQSAAEEGKAQSPGDDAAQPETQISTEKKLDLFFADATPQSLKSEQAAGETESPKEREETIEEDEKSNPAGRQGEGEGAPKPASEGPAITKSSMAKLFWDQGFYKKALVVIVDELLADPDDADLHHEFEAICNFLGQDPDEVLAEKLKKS